MAGKIMVSLCAGKRGLQSAAVPEIPVPADQHMPMKFASMRRPVAPLFSGWNWTP